LLAAVAACLSTSPRGDRAKWDGWRCTSTAATFLVIEVDHRTRDLVVLGVRETEVGAVRQVREMPGHVVLLPKIVGVAPTAEIAVTATTQAWQQQVRALAASFAVPQFPSRASV
jgi:hypothetical protein